jgi:endonuclease-3
VPSAEEVRKVSRLLEMSLGRPLRPNQMDPIGGLVLAILSQNTNDRNRDRAFGRLRERFGSWEEVALASPSEVEEAIRPAGLSKVKSERIINCLRTLKGGDGTLDSLKGMSLEEAEGFLTSIPGIGLKTARCVLLFQLGLPAFPVDTHIMRVSKRLGWIPEKASARKAHEILQNSIPHDLVLDLHINMIRLGRTLCRPRNPRCGQCPLLEECSTGKRERASTAHG